MTAKLYGKERNKKMDANTLERGIILQKCIKETTEILERLEQYRFSSELYGLEITFVYGFDEGGREKTRTCPITGSDAAQAVVDCLFPFFTLKNQEYKNDFSEL